MIDNFALALIHFLLAVAVWKLLVRPDLDCDADESETPPLRPRKPRRPRQ